MPSAPPRITLFRNRWLERLTVISAPAFLLLWGVLLPLIGWQAMAATPAAQRDPLPLAGLLVLGAGLWTLTEYGLHRFVFHWEPRSPLLRQLVFIMHGNHHEQPNDPLRNLMPPVVSLPVGGLIWLAMLGLAGPAGHWLFLGFIAGYVGYDLVHYGCHQWPMRGRMARLLKTHHMRHHHLRAHGNYAITGMIWDRLLRTRLGHQPVA